MNGHSHVKMAILAAAIIAGYVWVVPELRYQLFKPREFSEDPHYAIILDDVKLLRKHLKRDPQIVFSRAYGGGTLLHSAARDDDPKFVTCLLEEGAPVDIEDAGGFTPLYGAIMSGKLATAKVLIAAGADVSRRWKWPPPMKPGASILEMAALGGHYELVKLALDHGADATPLDETDSALHLACQRVVTPDEVSYPANKGNRLIIDLLAKHLKSINLRGASQQTPLHAAAEIGNVDTVRHLLATYPDIDVDAKDVLGKTAADLAMKSGSGNSVEIVELIRQQKAAKQAP